MFICTQETSDMMRMEAAIRKSDWSALKSVYNSAFFCSLGFFVVGFLIPIIAYGYMSASATEVALVFALLTLGIILFSPIAGKIAKKGNRRLSISVGAFARAIAYLGMAISVFYADKYLLMLNSLLWGLGAAFYRVGSDAEISERVIPEDRAEAFGHREAANGKGSVIGAFLGFGILLNFENYPLNIISVFILFAMGNMIGGFMVLKHRPALEQSWAGLGLNNARSVIGLGIVALVLAAAIDTFITALLSPFVELYILEYFTQDIMSVALVYLPGGVISGILGGRMGRFAGHQSKIGIISLAVLVGSISTLGIVFLPNFLAEPVNLISIAVLFTISSATGVMAYTIMSSIFGTAYQGRASEGFGLFETAMGLARFSAPIIGGILWDSLNPSAPFILVGLSGFILIPIYAYGMRQYDKAITIAGTSDTIVI